MNSCPLCQNKNSPPYHHDGSRSYLHCPTCGLVFVPSQFHLSPIEEKAIYDMHQNNPEDQGYRKHLNKLATPLLQHIENTALGLDYGSGPGPTLSLMFEEKGHDMAIYDPIYADDKSVLSPSEPYDFITLSEVIEHIHHPAKDLQTLWNILKPQGFLGIMTGLSEDLAHFQSWHYTRDPTHVCFYSKTTFNWLAKKLGAELSFPSQNIILLKKI